MSNCTTHSNSNVKCTIIVDQFEYQVILRKVRTRPGVQQCQAQGLVLSLIRFRFRTGLGYVRLTNQHLNLGHIISYFAKF